MPLHALLEDVAWNKPDSKTLEHLVWLVYDGILSPGPTPKLTGPKSYNQVTRRLASKVFRGVQVLCPTCMSAQFDEPSPVRVRSVVFAVPPSGVPKRSEATEAMDMSPRKVAMTVEGAVGGQAEEDPNTHPMAWMRDRQNSYSDEMIHFWLYSAHSWMVEGRRPGVLRIICSPPGNGWLPPRLRPVRHVCQPNLMSQVQSGFAQLSSPYPQAGCQKDRRPPRPCTRVLVKLP